MKNAISLGKAVGIIKHMELEILPEYSFVLEAVTARQSILFVTGKAGTGKSTLIHYLKDNIKKLHITEVFYIANRL